jgi:hypothetical protein
LIFAIVGEPFERADERYGAGGRGYSILFRMAEGRGIRILFTAPSSYTATAEVF